MKNIKRIARIAVYILISVWTIGQLGMLVRPLDEGFDTWHYFYEEDDDTINAVFIGSSAIFQYWIPPRAYEEYGFTSFLLAHSAQDFRAVPYIMEEAQKSQKADLIVIETRQLVANRVKEYRQDWLDTEQENYYFSMVSAGMKPSLRRAEMIHEILYQDEQNKEIEWQIPVLKYHENFFDFSKEEWHDRLTLGSHIYKSARQKARVEPQEEEEMDDNLKDIFLTQEDKACIDKIIKKAEDLDIKILFISTPYIAGTYRYPLQEQLAEYMEEKEYPYLDLYTKRDEIGLDLDTDFYNDNHTNIAGADKVTDYLAEYLSQEYSFPDRLNEKQKEDWDTSAAAWKEKEAELLTKWEENCREQNL